MEINQTQLQIYGKKRENNSRVKNSVDLKDTKDIKDTEKKVTQYRYSESPGELIQNIVKIFLNSYNRKFEDFLDICLFALESKEKEYMEVVKRLDREFLMDYCKAYGELFYFFYYEQKYWDVLGEVYMRVVNLRKRSDEAYTPFHICRCMAAISDPKPGDKFMDPCCGSGAFQLAVKEHLWLKYNYNSSVNLFGCDILPTAVKMAKIQDYLTNYNYMGALLLSKTMELK